jgi:hypothetical protein
VKPGDMFLIPSGMETVNLDLGRWSNGQLPTRGPGIAIGFEDFWGETWVQGLFPEGIGWVMLDYVRKVE